MGDFIAHERLRESEEHHRLFFEQSRDAMMTLAPPSWRFTSGNPAACAMYGARDQAEFTQLGPWDVSPERQPDGQLSAEKSQQAIAIALRDGSHSFEWMHRRLDGHEFPTIVLLTRMTIAGQTLLQAIVRNVSAQYAAEHALRAERDLFSSGPVCIMVWGAAAHWPIQQVSSNVEAILGYSAAEMMHPDFRFGELLHPDDAPRISAEVVAHIARHEDSFEQSYRLKRKDGVYRWFYDFSRLTRNSDGEVELIRGYLFDQSHLKETELALEHERQRLDDILTGTRAGTWDWNIQTGAVVFNERWAEIIGYRLAELEPLSIKTWYALAHPEDLELSHQLLQRHFSGELEYYECDLRVRHKAGHWVWVQDRGCVATRTPDGQPLLMRGTHQNINARKLAEERLKLAASVFTHAREGIVMMTADGTIIDINDAFTQITGYSREEALGRDPQLWRSDHHPEDFYTTLWRRLIDQGCWSGELWNRRKNGEAYAALLTISAVYDDQGQVLHYVALFTDITQLKEHQHRLEHLAHYDALTTLPNRTLLAHQLQQAMVQAHRTGRQVAVVYLDLDGFKAINDRHGHQAGDQLLIVQALRIRQLLRAGDTLARLGGDEFVAVLVDLPDRTTTEALLARLLQVVNDPVRVLEVEYQVTVSLGVTFYPQVEEVDADQLLRQADQAMYQAKLAGKNRYHCFDTEHDRSARGRHASLERIRHALANNEFVLYYQPKVNMRTGVVVGAEALIRWQHPEQGLLPPNVFLPVIEDHPLGVELGEWVIDTALRQIAAWHASGLNLAVSVNIGARQLQQSDFVERLRALLHAHPHVKPSRLDLEVLESSAFEDLSCISTVIAACRALGVHVDLDDFGTGYSSLTYLKRLPVNALKIDQSFVRDMLDDPEDLAIVESVLGLAAAFRRQAIAEGVETCEHGLRLLQLGCKLAQGYGIARPMPAAALPEWSASWQPDPSWMAQPPLSREDLPLIHAIVEHRAWSQAIVRTLDGQQIAAMPLDVHHCRFGEWLDSGGLAYHPSQHAVEEITHLHHQLHHLGQTLLELHAQSHTPVARAQLEVFLNLGATLTERVQALAMFRER